MRLGENEVIATPTGVSKGFMSPDMLIKTDINGNVISGYLSPSSELKIHLEAYKHRPDVKAFVHAHPPYSTGFAVANLPLNFKTLPEIIISLGSIPLAKYGTPSTVELSDSISELVKSHDAILLANHGAVTLGKDVMSAYYKMESVEHFALISLTARQLGGMKFISEPEVKKLEEVREKFGIKIGGTACMECGTCTGTCSNEQSTKDEREQMIENVVKQVMKELSE
jgi:L-fuculose-phosphate aldolase